MIARGLCLECEVCCVSFSILSRCMCKECDVAGPSNEWLERMDREWSSLNETIKTNDDELEEMRHQFHSVMDGFELNMSREIERRIARTWSQSCSMSSTARWSTFIFASKLSVEGQSLWPRRFWAIDLWCSLAVCLSTQCLGSWQGSWNLYTLWLSDVQWEWVETAGRTVSRIDQKVESLYHLTLIMRNWIDDQSTSSWLLNVIFNASDGQCFEAGDLWLRCDTFMEAVKIHIYATWEFMAESRRYR